MRPPSHARVLAPAPRAAQTKRQIDVLLSGCISGIPEKRSSNASSLTEQLCLALPGPLSAKRERSWLAGPCHSPPEMLVQSGAPSPALCRGLCLSIPPGFWSTPAPVLWLEGVGGALSRALPTLGRVIPHYTLLHWFAPELLYSLSGFSFQLTLTLVGINITAPPMTDFCVSTLGFLIPACSHLDLPLQEDVHTLLLV